MYQATLTQEQVKRIIAHVEYASKDTSLPVLNTVHIVADRNTLTVSSTDRYVLAESTLTVDNWDGGVIGVNIPIADITNWKQLVKGSQFFQLSLETDGWSLDTFNSKVTGKTVEEEYPNVAKLFPKDRLLHPIAPTTLSVVNLDKLGKFARTAGIPPRDRTWKIGQSEPKNNSPILALVEGTRVLVMPIVNYNDPESSPEEYRHA